MRDIRPITLRRAYEAAVEQLADGIRLGELSEGDRLPSERELAETMQISRPSLREAIQVLTEVGVLEARRGPLGGIYVVSTYVPTQLLDAKYDLRLDEMRSVLEARRLLEPRVAQLAAVHATEEDYDRMQSTIDAQKLMFENGTVESNKDRFLAHDTNFHMRMAGASHNSTIISFMRTLSSRLAFAREFVVQDPENPQWVIDIHERTLAAIRLGDHSQIEKVFEEHLRNLEVAWERTAETSLLRSLPEFLVPASERLGAGHQVLPPRG